VRLAGGIDAQFPFDQAADARPLVPVQIRNPAGRKRHAVAAPQQIAFRQGLQPRHEPLARDHAGAVAPGSRRAG
jgi:hypothetical protein